MEPAAPRWLNPQHVWLSVIPEKHLEVLSGKAQINEIFRNSVRHEYTIHSGELSVFKENTAYFPGWTAYANGKKINMNYQNPKYPGIITFILPSGYYNVRVIFEDTIWTFAGKLISIVTVIGTCLFLSIRFLKPKVLNRR